MLPAVTQEALPQPAPPSRFFVTALYAPELSTVRRAGYTRPGRNLGVQAEYRLNARLRLNVGLISSVKHYQARGRDYQWAYTPPYPVEHVEAVCRITDVPVNLRLDAWQSRRGQLFVSGGLSSLLMRDEQYEYDYTYYGTYYSQTWRVKKGGNHLFSVLNLSAGYEWQLTPHWGVQAEPYLKLPLGGVGAGKVRLSSSGIFLGLKYGL
ncbi:hypothetical protein [Hymenobacter coalescens]